MDNSLPMSQNTGKDIDIANDAKMLANPEPVNSENVGKDASETLNIGEPAASNAQNKLSSLLCGPILRYTRQSEDFSVWHGSAMIVQNRRDSEPTLSIHSVSGKVSTTCIWSEESRHFWRFSMDIKQESEAKEVKYTIDLHDGATELIERSFWIAPKKESFNILFHSCNGFCDGAEKDYEGPTLWKDVLRAHEKKPFHVMLGGGDQIYSDYVTRKGGPLEEWSQHLTPRHKARIQFTEELRLKVDQWYFVNSCDWFNTTPFREATGQIPSVNIWDDHDIIDGFGSYKDKWMRAPVFTGIGEIAWKWYTLFQHHINPNTTSNPDPDRPSDREKEDPEYIDEPSYIIHPKVGPYIKHRGISLMSSFGKNIAYVGFDCRTDRTLKTICYKETYNAIFSRLEKEVVKGQTKHLLVLLGVPIAYPRLVWLEAMLKSQALLTPLRLVNKALGGLSGVFNNFDDSAELLDDLQDHWACGIHKQERNRLVERLQAFAKAKQVRITILSGDVHLAAVGRFYSKKKLQIPQRLDHRYIVNIISSAITNAPPPPAVAQVLNQRNKVHRLGRHTQENLMKIFNVSVDNSERYNQTTYPARNYCIITPQREGDSPLIAAEPTEKHAQSETDNDVRAKKVRGSAVDNELNLRQDGPGISLGAGGEGALSISIQIEIDQKSKDGFTKSYGFSIPTLQSA